MNHELKHLNIISIAATLLFQGLPSILFYHINQFIILRSSVWDLTRLIFRNIDALFLMAGLPVFHLASLGAVLCRFAPVG